MKMREYKKKELKEKALGSLEETAGKIMDSKTLEIKGKVRQGLGKAYGYADQFEVAKAKRKQEEVEEKDNDTTKKIVYGLGIATLLYLMFRNPKKAE